jgi:transcriptional regulator with XRE-family HTH domain
MPDDNPIVQRRRLRTALRQHREAASFTQRDAAEQLDWSISKLVRIESGNQSISVSDLQAALSLYGVTDEDTVAVLKELARSARSRPWWHDYRDIVSVEFSDYLGHESDSTSLVDFHPFLIPALLHTPDYNAALLSFMKMPARTARIVQLKTRRQELLFARPGVLLEFIMTEEAIGRWIGGRDTMRLQLEHIQEVGRRPNVSIRIVPLTAGVHPGLGGSFVVVQNEAGERIVYLESMNGDQLTKDEPAVLVRYDEYIRELNGAALSLDATDALLKAQVERLR